MKRVFMFTGQHMKVFEWQGRTLLASYDFRNREDDLQLFNRYLSESPRLSAYLLIDTLEEDFRQETIPHVGAKDQQIMIARLFDRHYRDYRYRHVTRQGRNKTGRRDDCVLLSAITSTESLDPWFEQFKAHDIPLAGIWSLALLSHQVLKFLDTSGDNVLLISREMRSALRETFFKQGRLAVSRQAKLLRSADYADEHDQVLDNVYQGADQIHKFLTNQRLIGFNEPLMVRYLCSEAFYNATMGQNIDVGQIQIRFHPFAELRKQLGLIDCEGQEVDAIFAYLCSQQRAHQKHYTPYVLKTAYHKHIADRVIQAASWAGSLLLLAAAGLVGLSSMELDQQRVQLQTQLRNLNANYAQHYAGEEHKITDAMVYAATVALAQNLRAESTVSLDAFFPTLSQVMADSHFAAFSVTTLDWQKLQGGELSAFVQEGKTQEQLQYELENGIEEEVSTAKQPIVRLQGYLDRGDMEYRQVVNMVAKFIAAFKALPGVLEVRLVRAPVDVRPSVIFNDASGPLKDSIEATDEANAYELVLRLQGAERNDE